MEYYTKHDSLSGKTFVSYGDVIVSNHATLSEANQAIFNLTNTPPPVIEKHKYICDLCGNSLHDGYSLKDTFFNFWLDYESIRDDEYLVICLVCNSQIKEFDYKEL